MKFLRGTIIGASIFLSGCLGLEIPDFPATAFVPQNVPVSADSSRETWRIARATFYLTPSPDPVSIPVFRFSGVGAKSSEIHFAFVNAPTARVNLACNGPFRFTAPGYHGAETDGSEVETDIRSDLNGQSGAVLVPDVATSQCQVKARFANVTRHYVIQREEVHFPQLSALDVAHKDCASASSPAKDPLQAAFQSDDGLSMFCAIPSGNVDMLDEPAEAFNARVKALLGKPLSKAFIDGGDPFAPIDFSSAPELNLVLISALDFKADFSGTVMSRLIRHHAARGVPVRIMASTILERRKDKRLLQRLAGEFPNVSVVFFAYNASSILDPNEALAAMHRVHHVKLFATMGRNGKNSVAILGGRNIHDGFLFTNPLDLRKHPQLQTYPGRGAMTLNYYTNWHDFDVAFHEPVTVRKLVAHFNWLWTSDLETHAFRTVPTERPISNVSAPLRHFLSIPYRDDHALEKTYVRLIDAAHERIEIVNPYLNLTQPLKAAFDRAIARGVKIEIIGRIDMRGDLGGEMLTAVNEKFVSENHQRISIRDYRAPNVVLHSKILLIDGKLSIVSSVNLNNRSFLHDTENGVMIFDRNFTRKMQLELERYRRLSDPVTSANGWTIYHLLLLSPLVRQTF